MSAKRLGWWCWLLLVVPLAAAPDPVKVTATVEPATAHPGEVAVLQMTAAIAAGYHLYGTRLPAEGPVPTRFAPAPGLAALGDLREPTPLSKFDEGFNVPVTIHEGTVAFRQPFRVPTGAKPGPLVLAGELKYQACTNRSCLRPARQPVKATVTVAAGPVRAAYRDPPADSPPASAGPVAAAPPPVAPAASVADRARAQGLPTFLLVAFLAGLAALLTPCVFPMVPITVSYFTKQAGDNPRRRVALAVSYGLGIMVTYTTLGLVLAATLGAGGAQRLAANPWLNLFIAALFGFFALSLFGAFELRLPSGVVNFADRRSELGGYLGALFMGLTLTLAAFTCTVQFVGGVLVWAANGQWLWPILGMLAFSLAFALPFVLLALFPQYLAALPRSGGWLETTKVVLGWIELGAAVKFISNADLVWRWLVFTRELVLALWAVCALLSALYLAGWLPMGHASPAARPSRRRWLAVGAFGLLSLWFLWGLTGAKLTALVESLLPPSDYRRGAAAGGGEWLEDLDAALQQAAATRRLVFVDFTGVTCTNCRWMEQNLFPRAAVAARLARLVRVRLYTDTGPLQQQYRDLQVQRFQTAALPFYAILRADGTAVATFDGLTRDEAAFVAFLDQAR